MRKHSIQHIVLFFRRSMKNRTTLESFFQILWGSEKGFAELRLIGTDKTIRQCFFEYPEQLDKLVAQAQEANGKYNVFFGVCLRKERRGRTENVSCAPGFWCDIDFKNTPMEEAFPILKSFLLKPTVCNLSGFGLQSFWVAKEPISDLKCVVAINKGLVKVLKGDPGATDIARVLRVPGTKNLKYDPPRECRNLIWNPELLYHQSDFDFLPSGHEHLLDEIKRQEEKNAIIPEGKRNDTLFQLAGTMRQKGMSKEAIFQALKVTNEEKCKPPLPEEEVRRLAQSIGEYKAGNITGGGKSLATKIIEALEPSINLFHDGQEKVYARYYEMSVKFRNNFRAMKS